LEVRSSLLNALLRVCEGGATGLLVSSPTRSLCCVCVCVCVRRRNRISLQSYEIGETRKGAAM
jgi:hypothetical protein